MERKPNCKCSVCEKEIYRRPKDKARFKAVYCSSKCCGLANRKQALCPCCFKEFAPEKETSKYCSRECSNKGRTGIKYNKGCQNATQLRLKKLKETFDFKSCMIENCVYDKTFDIHRYVWGKDGGKYEIGNMFAICPNHHAEITRKIISVVKVDDKTLRVGP